jgi:hypothetical protein
MSTETMPMARLASRSDVATAAPFLDPSHQLMAPVFQGGTMVGVCSGARAAHWASANPATTVTPGGEFGTPCVIQRNEE